MATGNLAIDVRKRANWSILMGVLTAALGMFLIAYPLATAAIATVLLGWVLMFVGITQFVFAFHSHTVGNFFMKVLLGILYGIAGLVLVLFPLQGVVQLTALLGILLLFHAGVAIALAFEMRPASGWGWFLVDAGAALLVAILILAKWPVSSFWAIGTLIGVSVLMNGITKIMVASRIRNITGSLGGFKAA